MIRNWIAEYFGERLFSVFHIVVPLSWYPSLLNASPKERENWQLLGDGYAIEWPDLDEHIGIEGLLAGRRSGESQKSFQRWLASRQ
ncbi:DUF2442 domain-containing protein [candidate division KSB1 bacterium]|nr:MAG: DUF2442 domain-containing protein [candidate division KSB1 bacterium]